MLSTKLHTQIALAHYPIPTLKCVSEHPIVNDLAEKKRAKELYSPCFCLLRTLFVRRDVNTNMGKYLIRKYQDITCLSQKQSNSLLTALAVAR